jgi:3-methyl-2-oxobutanoate hydroxymethyltransferase
VFHDMLGMTSHPHHAQFVPKFCKSYAQLGHIIQDGLAEYKRDVESGTFPGAEYSPYTMKEDERKAFEMLLAKDAAERQKKHDKVAKDITDQDEYEKLHLYGPISDEPRKQ